MDDTLNNLRASSAIVLEARGPVDVMHRALETAPGVARVGLTRKDGELAAFEIIAADGADLREALAARVVQNGWALRRLDLRRTTLEDRFIQAVTHEAVTAEAAVEAG